MTNSEISRLTAGTQGCEKGTMKAFICSPYRGDIEKNVKKAQEYARKAAMMGVSPIVPHLLFPQFLKEEDPDERDLGIRLGLEQLAMCDELWVFGDEISQGMSKEISFAEERGIPIKHFSDYEEEM